MTDDELNVIEYAIYIIELRHIDMSYYSVVNIWKKWNTYRIEFHDSEGNRIHFTCEYSRKKKRVRKVNRHLWINDPGF